MGLNERQFAGQKIEFGAAEINAIRDSTRKSRAVPAFAADISGFEKQSTLCKVRNNTGANLDRFAVVGIGDPIITPTENEDEFQRQLTFEGETPAAGTHEGKYAVLLRPIPDGDIGDAVISGVVPCKLAVDVLDDVFGWAEIAGGETATLANVEVGSARVLWAEESGTERWALVRLAEHTPAALDEMVRVTGDAPLFGRYPAVIQDYDADAGAWSDRDGGDCYAIDPAGTALAEGIYLARRWGEYSGLPVFTPTEDGGLVKVSANDTNVGYLNGKLVAGLNTNLTENNDGSNETLTVDALTEVESVTWSSTQTSYALPSGKHILDVTLSANVLLNSLGGHSAGRHLYVRVNESSSSTYALRIRWLSGTGTVNIETPNAADVYLRSGEGCHFFAVGSGGSALWICLGRMGINITSVGGVADPNVDKVFIDTTNGLAITTGSNGTTTISLREAQAGSYNGAVTDQAQAWTGIKQFQKYIRLPFGAYGSLGTDTATLTPADTVQFFTINPTANISVYSIAGVTGRFFILANKNSTYTITVVHDDGATGTAGGRFLCPAATSFTLSRNEMAIFWYDSDVSAYRASKIGGGSTPSSTQDGTLLIGVSGSFVEKFPITNSEGYIVTNNEGLIVASGV